MKTTPTQDAIAAIKQIHDEQKLPTLASIQARITDLESGHKKLRSDLVTLSFKTSKLDKASTGLGAAFKETLAKKGSQT